MLVFFLNVSLREFQISYLDLFGHSCCLCLFIKIYHIEVFVHYLMCFCVTAMLVSCKCSGNNIYYLTKKMASDVKIYKTYCISCNILEAISQVPFCDTGHVPANCLDIIPQIIVIASTFKARFICPRNRRQLLQFSLDTKCNMYCKMVSIQDTVNGLNCSLWNETL